MHTNGPSLTLLGLTGGVGMGKSVAADFLRGFGLPVVDTDQLARDLVLPGQPALEEIRRAFGDAVIGADGQLRRDVLAGIVFGDDLERQRLEHILHPRIRAAWLEQVRLWKGQVGRAVPGAPAWAGGKDAVPPDSGKAPDVRAGVVVIPLLFETGAESECTATICVACSVVSQAQRLAARGWSAQEAERRIRAQWPVERKLASADFVVWAEGGADRTREQLDRILRQLGLSVERPGGDDQARPCRLLTRASTPPGDGTPR